MSNPLLDVTDLTVRFRGADGPVTVVDRLGLTIARGEKVALVGESGSGKSVTAQSVLGILRDADVSGSVVFDGVDLGSLSAKELALMRGDRMGLIFQDPLSSLNPVMTVGAQITEPLRIRGVGKKEAVGRAVDLLDRLGVPRAAERMADFPHQFSGGMRQRVMIAIAMIGDPDLLIADEPTTALDVRIQQQVLDMLHELADERDMAVLLITHDLGIVAGFADTAVVMYAGRKVEQAPVEEIFHAPQHPYTRGLVGSVPRIDEERSARLTSVPGAPPPPANRPSGCAFHPRCAIAVAECELTEPPMVQIGVSQAACLLADGGGAAGTAPRAGTADGSTATGSTTASSTADGPGGSGRAVIS